MPTCRASAAEARGIPRARAGRARGSGRGARSGRRGLGAAARDPESRARTRAVRALLLESGSGGGATRGLAPAAMDYVDKPYDASYVVSVRATYCASAAPVRMRRRRALIDDSITFRHVLSEALTHSG